MLGGNPGFGAANNAGVALCTPRRHRPAQPGRRVALDGALRRLAARAAVRDALHVPRLLNADGTRAAQRAPVPGRAGRARARGRPPAPAARGPRETADPWRAETEREVGWAIAAVLAGRTATLRALGPFDPAAFLFFEDLELGLRARAAGVPTILHPGLRLVHAGQHSTGPALGAAHELQARRRREVVRRRARAAGAGPRRRRPGPDLRNPRRRPDGLVRRDGSRPRAQLAALRAARRYRAKPPG